MDNHKQPIVLGRSEGQISIFVFGVVGIEESYREGISEHGCRILEGDPVRI
jgi:hypothetical protein